MGARRCRVESEELLGVEAYLVIGEIDEIGDDGIKED